MRIKPSDGPLSIHNGNPDILNSPKRLNTLQNTNLTTSNLILSRNATTTESLTTDNINNINAGDTVQWCNGALQQRIINNRNNQQLYNINNTLAGTLTEIRHGSSVCSESSPDDSLLDYEEASPQEEERCFELSDSESVSEDGNECRKPLQRHQGIVNPNYPGFQHLAHTLDFCIKTSDTELTDEEFEYDSTNNNNNELVLDKIDSVNRLDSIENIQKVFHEKTVFDGSNGNEVSEGLDGLTLTDEKSLPALIEHFPTNQTTEQLSLATNVAFPPPEYTYPEYVKETTPEVTATLPVVLDDSTTVTNDLSSISSNTAAMVGNLQQPANGRESPVKCYESKLTDAFLSGITEEIKMEVRDSNRQAEEKLESNKREAACQDEVEKFCKEDKPKDEAVPRKKEKMEMNWTKRRRDWNQQTGVGVGVGCRARDGLARRSAPVGRDKKRAQSEVFGGFDVYNIETAMPKIDLEAIEIHLRAAREEERRRRTDREEIRRRLAMGSDDYYSGYDRPGRKPSLQARLQSGMNLQICFMNENVSDTESPSSDSECPMTNPKQPKTSPKKNNNNSPVTEQTQSLPAIRPATLSVGQPLLQPLSQPMTETDFFTRQARLQTEARMALAQAKEMARMQMEIERQRQKKSPITEMVRSSLEKVGIPFPEEKRRLSRQILTEMNVAQLQVIVNDLHTQIETLNENLVKFLMNRDDLHMEQDSMLVDIEDLTRYLGAKQQNIKEHHSLQSNNNTVPPSPAPSSPLAVLNSSVKPHLNRIASLVKK